MIETLLGQMKGVLGKSFLLAGLLPSAIFLLAWRWYREDEMAIARIVRGLFNKREEAAQEAAYTALLLLGGGLLFFSCRGPILRLLQSLDWKALSWLSEWARKRQRRKRAGMLREEEEQRLELDVFLWIEAFGPYRARTPAAMPTENDAVEASRKARALVDPRSSPYTTGQAALLSAEHERSIIEGLTLLYVVSTRVRTLDDEPTFDSPPDSPPEAEPDSPPAGIDSPPLAAREKEIDEWRSLIEQPAARAILAQVEASQLRRLLRTTIEIQASFPRDEQWLEPTELGNRIAALDDYAEQRYRINTSTLWTRLLGVLPKESRAEVTDAQLSLEVLTNFCVGFLAFGSLILVTALWRTWLTLSANCQVGTVSLPSWFPQVFCSPNVIFNLRAVFAIGLSCLLSFVSYRGAIYAFGTLAEKMIRMVDLYRLQLITALGYKFPSTVGEELEILEELQKFFAQAHARKLSRPLAPSPAPKKEAKDGAKDDAEQQDGD